MASASTSTSTSTSTSVSAEDAKDARIQESGIRIQYSATAATALGRIVTATVTCSTAPHDDDDDDDEDDNDDAGDDDEDGNDDDGLGCAMAHIAIPNPSHN
ncbi:hypothetical protein ACLKA6_008147 [Drosophila palustris]